MSEKMDSKFFKPSTGDSSVPPLKQGQILRGAHNGWPVECFGSLRRDRLRLEWYAGQRGKPGLNADILSATEATRMVADPDFELLGTNAVSACSAFNAEGGLTLTTTTAASDQVILTPHQDANQSAWKQFTWGSDKNVMWETVIRTPASIADLIIWAGLKLTDTPVVATDANQAFFRFEASASANFQAISSIAGTDTEADTEVAVAVSTPYHLRIQIDGGRNARFFVNDVLVATSGQLPDATDLVPFVGVQTKTTAAKSLGVIGQAIERDIG